VKSTLSFATARQWISECSSSHKDCPLPLFWSDAKLPTRLIDVGLTDGIVKLRETLPDERANSTKGYVTLSYVWGESDTVKQFKATIANHTSLRQSIDVPSLPKTVQDAIYATVQLGIPYLWVDALCIIQDDEDDFSRELSTMAQVYRHATVTISAATATHCQQGFLEPRQKVLQIHNASFHLPFFVPDQPRRKLTSRLATPFRSWERNVASYEIGQISLCPDPSLGHELTPITGYHEQLPVLSRAWTLQESWLSSRVLEYGFGSLRWKCLTCEGVEGCTDNTLGFTTALSDDRKWFFPRRPDGALYEDVAGPTTLEVLRRRAFDRDVTVSWKFLVQDYTGRHLTVSSDKLKALSAMASEFHRLSKYEYYAGLWDHNMRSQLLWHHSSLERGLPTEYRAPSWSWAAVNGCVTFSVNASINFIGRAGYEVEAPTEPEVIIHSCKAIPAKNTEPFGAVAAGELTVTAPMRSMTWDLFRVRFNASYDGTPNYYSDYVVLDGGKESPLWPPLEAEVSGQPLPDGLPEALRTLSFLELTREEGPAGVVQ
jgi:hypothetical protein